MLRSSVAGATGTDAACAGPRPVLLYSHGTSVEKSYNIASPSTSEAGLVAAFYAAQGWIVVTSNYVGYDASRSTYHPYLVAEQQSNDMIDALRAARKAFTGIGANDSGKLFLSGYSQGGHVSMATHKAMQTNYASEFKVTAEFTSRPRALTRKKCRCSETSHSLDAYSNTIRGSTIRLNCWCLLHLKF